MYPARRGRRTKSLAALLVSVLTISFVAGCAGGGSGQEEEEASEKPTTEETTGGMADMRHGAKGMQGTALQTETVDPSAAGVNVDFTSDPAEPQPNQPVTLRYLLTDAGSGRVLTDLPIEMENPMHLIAVSQDLSQFQHLHPAIGNDDAHTVTSTLPEAAIYVLFDEFVYNEQNVLDRRELNVGRASEESASLSPDLSSKTESGLTASLSAPQTIEAGEDVRFTLQVTRDGRPVTDLEPYLGVPAHMIIVSSDTRDFAHSHGEASEAGNTEHEAMQGMEGMESMGSSSGTFGPEVSFHHTFPRSGLYKLWIQFGYRGSIITVPYVVEVS